MKIMERTTFKLYGGCLTPNCGCPQFDGRLSDTLESLCGGCEHAKYVHQQQEVAVVNHNSMNVINSYGVQQSSGLCFCFYFIHTR